MRNFSKKLVSKDASLVDIISWVQHDFLSFCSEMIGDSQAKMKSALGEELGMDLVHFKVLAPMIDENNKPKIVNLMEFQEELAKSSDQNRIPTGFLSNIKIEISLKASKEGESALDTLHDALGENIKIAKLGVKLEDNFRKSHDANSKAAPIYSIDASSMKKIHDYISKSDSEGMNTR